MNSGRKGLKIGIQGAIDYQLSTKQFSGYNKYSTTLWYNYIGEQKQYNSNVKIDALHLVNLSLSYSPNILKNNLSLTLSVNDLFDEHLAEVPAANSYKADEFVTSKRHYLMQLNYKF